MRLIKKLFSKNIEESAKKFSADFHNYIQKPDCHCPSFVGRATYCSRRSPVQRNALNGMIANAHNFLCGDNQVSRDNTETEIQRCDTAPVSIETGAGVTCESGKM
jgi:hypothetical protein